MAKTKAVHGEVEAMGIVEKALEPLGPDERGRVMRWASERFGVSTVQRPPGTPTRGAAQRGTSRTSENAPQEIGEFYAQAGPKTEAERALVVGYWVQQANDDGTFEAQAVNAQLKNLGHGVSNITRALDELKRQKPQLVIQIQKSGKSRQARKRYKVTSAGKAEVQRMLSESSEA
jgi:hypothetical protein